MQTERVSGNWSSTAPSSATTTANRHAAARNRRRRQDPFFEHYFKRIDPRVAASFTEEQRQAIRSMFDGRMAAHQHAVDLRRSLGFGRSRFYFVFLLGRERRLLPQSANAAVANLGHFLGYLVLTGGLLAALAAFVYHVKG